MRIISSFKDFYDSIMSYGLDRSILYVRETREIGPETPKNFYYSNMNAFYVGFCGCLYAGVFYYYHDKYYNYHYKFFYDLDSVNAFIKDNPNIEDCRWRFSKYTQNSFKGHFGENRTNREEKTKEIYFKYNSPIFIEDISKRITIINPCLYDWEFFRVMDPFTAYLEVSNFVGGVLQNEMKPIPKIDDVTLASAKGFDKWSFRKEPKVK